MSVQFSPVAFLKRKAGMRMWIEEVIKEPMDPNKDLALQLQSGVIVCKVMEAVREGSIPKIHTNTTLQFKIRENIMFFLHACEEMGIPRYKIFSIPDLIENKNSFKVLECLEELAFIAEQDESIPVLKAVEGEMSFPEEELVQAEALLKSIGMHQLRGAPDSLAKRRSVAVQAHRKSTPNPIRSSSPSHSPSISSLNRPNHAAPSSPLSSSGPPSPLADQAENKSTRAISNAHSRRAINSVPVEFNKTNRKIPLQLELTPHITAHTKAWIKLQSLVRGHLARRSHQKRVRNAAYRHNVAKEILSTERVYVKKLRVLVTSFLEPLREAVKSGKVSIKPEQIKSIFSDIEVILNYNTTLLADLEPRVTNWSPCQCLGDIFIRVVAFLKVYTQYVKDYNTSMTTLNSCKENPKFVLFVRECEQSPESGGQDISSYLILPVQRIPRYSLLLSDLVKHTWPDHKDYKDLCGALKKVQEVAHYVNEKKREAENISKVLEIQNTFTGKFENLAEPHRRFVKEGQLIVGGDDSTTPRNFYLFNDLLVGTKPVASGLFQKKESQKVKEFIKLNHTDFYECISSDNKPDKPDKPEKAISPPSSPSPTSAPPAPFSSSDALSPPSSSSVPSSPNSSFTLPTGEKFSIPSTPQGVEVELGFEFVDPAAKIVYRFFTKTQEDKDSWLTEIRTIKADLEAKKKAAEQSSLRKAQERAQMAREVLSQQYATLRVKGRRFDASIFKQMEDEEGGGSSSSDTPGTPPAPEEEHPELEGVRDFARLRKLSQAPSPTNGRSTSPSRHRRTTLSSSASASPVSAPPSPPIKSKDDSALTEDKKDKRTSWFNSLRRKKKNSLAEELGKHLDITDPASLTTPPEQSSTAQ